VCFARSSLRLHNWLTGHRWFGPLIEHWQRNRSIARRTKVVALITIAATPAITILIGAPLWGVLAQLVVLTGASAWIWTRPEPAAANVSAVSATEPVSSRE
jgi:uncharacterized membrane protein YbaN (DUF454 family)